MRPAISARLFVASVGARLAARTHLARYIAEVVEQLDLSEVERAYRAYSGRERVDVGLERGERESLFQAVHVIGSKSHYFEVSTKFALLPMELQASVQNYHD